MASAQIEDISSKFNLFTEKPVKFLTVQEDIKEDVKSLVKTLYDLTKGQERKEKNLSKNALPELIIKDFDEEQIWQQLELQNSECWDRLVWDVANSISEKNDLTFPIETSPSNQEELEDEKDLSEEEPEEHIEENVKEIKKKKKKASVTPKVMGKPSIVDDKFFKLQEMEQFLLKEEKKEGGKSAPDSDEESIDYFEDIEDEDDDDSEEEGKDTKEMKYNEFFGGENDENNEEMDDEEESDDELDEEIDDEEEDITKENEKPKTELKKKVTFAGMSDDDDDNDESGEENKDDNVVKAATSNERKSEFELRQQRLRQQIERLEEKTLSDAPWQLKGEVDGLKRPQNSLLEEVVDFDLTSRPPPIITEQTTVTLEDIIKQRVKDKAWDDVVKKEKPVDDQLLFRKKEIMDQSKSKLSLAQVYEAEYLKQKQALSGEPEDEKEPEAHTQIRDAMNKLFSKLDALCHYHYTPKAPQAEVKIVSNTPAISMEEVAPVATSDAALLAPEEVKKKRRGDLKSKEERTNTDRKRERRKKKQFQKSKGGVEKVTTHRNTQKGTEVGNNKSLKTSKAFFQQLNDDATSIIKSKRSKNKGQ